MSMAVPVAIKSINCPKAELLPSFFADLDTAEAAGSIVTFENSVGLPVFLPKLIAKIKAVQDLHGYDHPWVGGAGKNLLEVTGTSTSHNGITYTVNSDSSGNVLSITAKGTASAESVFNIKMSTTLTASCILTGCPSGGSASTYSIQALNSGSTGILFTDTGSGATLTAQTYGRFRIRITSGTALPTAGIEFKPMIRLSSASDATYEPYTNICPISGWSSVNVNVAGVNVWDEEMELGTIDGNGANVSSNSSLRSKNYTIIKPSTQYYLKRDTNVILYLYDANKTFISQLSSPTEFTTPTNACYVRLRTGTGYGTTYKHDISINYPSTDHSYHAYVGNVYTTSLGSTYYGGSLNVTTGVLTVTHGCVDMGTLWWITENASLGIYKALVSGILTTAGTKPFICSSYRTALQRNNNGQSDYSVSRYNAYDTSSYIYINNSTFANYTTAQVTTALSGVQLVYELATPQTVQLTPQQVKTITSGINNIWADSGDVDVTYFTREA